MQLLGSEPVVNTVSRSPWLFASTDQAKGGGKKKKTKSAKRKSKANRRKSAKNKTRRRIYKWILFYW
jgi:hypothetical protein